mmetsp:Transcript_11384/g.17979  ORF Transcript_11384/g.17979 Transcript_11384/m.17979 type:complete len:213 (+) Transcript_11384:570-1208(+)
MESSRLLRIASITPRRAPMIRTNIFSSIIAPAARVHRSTGESVAGELLDLLSSSRYSIQDRHWEINTSRRLSIPSHIITEPQTRAATLSPSSVCGAMPARNVNISLDTPSSRPLKGANSSSRTPSTVCRDLQGSSFPSPLPFVSSVTARPVSPDSSNSSVMWAWRKENREEQTYGEWSMAFSTMRIEFPRLFGGQWERACLRLSIHCSPVSS